MEVLLRSLYGAMAVPRRCRGDPTADWPNPRWHCGSFEHVQSLRRATAKVRGFDSFPAVLRRSMTDPLRNHGDHGGATAVYAVQAPQWHRASGVTGVLPMQPRVLDSVVTLKGTGSRGVGPLHSWTTHRPLLF